MHWGCLFEKLRIKIIRRSDCMLQKPALFCKAIKRQWFQNAIYCVSPSVNRGSRTPGLSLSASGARNKGYGRAVSGPPALASPCVSCVVLDKLLNLSVPQATYIKIWIIQICPNIYSFLGWWQNYVAQHKLEDSVIWNTVTMKGATIITPDVNKPKTKGAVREESLYY